MRTFFARMGPVLAIALAACTSLQEVSPDTIITCSAASECPGGMVCNRGRCANPSALDTTPPDIVPGSVAVTPAGVKAGQAVTVTLQSTEPLEAAPTVALGLIPPVTMACSATSGLAYTCSHTATGHENGDLGGDIAIDVRMRDRAGNDTARSSVATIGFDFVPPSPTIASVGYDPAPTNPLPSVRMATAGTLVRVAVSADERLSTSTPSALIGRLGGSTLAFALVPGPLGGTDAVFETTVPTGLADGDYALEVSWTDEVGNPGTAAVPGAVVKVKTSTPTLAVNQDAVLFVRSPQGNGSPEQLGNYTIPAGPYFAIEPADPLSAGGRLPAGTFLLEGGPAPATPARVVVQLAAAPGSLQLGTLIPDDAGTWPRQPLASPDVTTVYIVGIDEAGNRSAAVKIANAEWVATSNPPLMGTSPHQLCGVPSTSPTRVQYEVSGLAIGPESAGKDGQSFLTQGWAEWELRTSATATNPNPRRDSAMAYDSSRGRVVLFGGDSNGSWMQDTWEWNGGTWTNVTPVGVNPRIRTGHAMAFDSARDRVVLFGGYDGGRGLQDTWEWNGSTWTNVTPAGPSPNPRWRHAMAYDSSRGRVVLFSGYNGTYLDDTWEWNGSTWTKVTPTGVGPGGRYRHAMAYDSSRGRVVLFGGFNGSILDLNDTWEWNGSTWTNVTPAGAMPDARNGHAMAYDSSRGRVVLFGGGVYFGLNMQDTWEWNGSAWTNVTPAGSPSARTEHAMAYDSSRGRLVLFGGYVLEPDMQETWEFNGSTWTNVTPAGSPSARTEHAMAYDSSRGRVVLFGGLSNTLVTLNQDTWEWNGSTWANATPAGVSPSARSRHSMAYDSSRGRAVLFGGSGNLAVFQDTWEWNGSTWTNVSPAGASPSARYEHAMAYDSSHGRVVLFGGANSATKMQDTWEWNGSTWTNVTPAGASPSARSGHAMAYDSSRGRVVLFGGSGGATGMKETWEWNGSAWTDVTPAGNNASAHDLHAMTFDSSRGRVVLSGGSSVLFEGSLDTWEWNGSTWTNVTSPAMASASARYAHAMAYDSSRGRVVLFGGNRYGVFMQDTWEWQQATPLQPALQFDANWGFAAPGLPTFLGVRVRAFAGGTYYPGGTSDVGATLYGWSNHDPLAGPGAWVSLKSNTTGVAAAQPYLPTGSASLIDWQSPDAATARRFLTERDGQLSFQVRPSGPMGPDVGGSTVALDYTEVRVRYTAP